jgi:hydroxymethylpyrimidine pyrophosphatase-like HAD family hydrolase
MNKMDQSIVWDLDKTIVNNNTRDNIIEVRSSIYDIFEYLKNNNYNIFIASYRDRKYI